MNKNIKLVVVDLDGTLLTSPKKVHSDNVVALRRLIKEGYQVLIATGADLARIVTILNQLDLPHHNLYCIALNGGVVYDFGSRKMIHKAFFTAKETKKFYEIGNKYRVQMIGTPVSESEVSYHGDIRGIFVIFQRLYLGYKIKKMDLNNPTPIFKALVGGKQKLQKAFLKELKANVKISCVTSYVRHGFYPFLEINAANVNKKIALKWLAEKFKIKPSEIIAIGDGHNDIEMLKYVGLSVSMGNARPEVKAVTKETTDTNHNAGVAKAIERLIFNNK